jgi:hypothetical protein
MESYVVRIYRRSGRRPRVLVGTVEMPGAEGKLAFSNAEELWEILESHGARGTSTPPESKDGARKEV